MLTLGSLVSRVTLEGFAAFDLASSDDSRCFLFARSPSRFPFPVESFPAEVESEAFRPLFRDGSDELEDDREVVSTDCLK